MVTVRLAPCLTVLLAFNERAHFRPSHVVIFADRPWSYARLVASVLQHCRHSKQSFNSANYRNPDSIQVAACHGAADLSLEDLHHELVQKSTCRCLCTTVPLSKYPAGRAISYNLTAKGPITSSAPSPVSPMAYSLLCCLVDMIRFSWSCEPQGVPSRATTIRYAPLGLILAPEPI